MEKINKTQLNLKVAEDRQIVHRDYLAHALRWSHILKWADIGQTWLDIGCGDFPMAMALYSNKFKPKLYIGADIRKLGDKIPETNFNIVFLQGDICKTYTSIQDKKFDNIVCLEMLEHVEKKHGLRTLDTIQKLANKNTRIFLSTPVFNGKAAGNHIHEWKYIELKEELLKRFRIEANYGTFASIRDIKPFLTTAEQEVFVSMHDYYDTNLLSIMFAPMHPAQSRNCIWVLRKK